MTVKEYLTLSKRYPFSTSTSYDGQEEDKEKIRQYNKELIKKYPWLEPTNRWSGKRISECAAGEKGYWPGSPDELPDWDWDYTELDNMPDGWRIAFGEQMCEEIQQALLHAQELDPNGGYKESFYTTNYDSDKVIPYVKGFQITEIKSKFAELRFYCHSAPKDVYDIIDKYTELSRYICECCGKPAEWISNGWIDPYCTDCAKNYINKDIEYLKSDKIEDSFTSINEFYKK